MPTRSTPPEDAILIPDPRPAEAAERALGDFSTDRDTLRLAAIALVVGAAVAVAALALLDLIAIITHLAYTGRWSTHLAPPDTSVLGPTSVVIPVLGGLVVGLMARFGSERIRGHGIPEAMETILLRGSRMEPRLAVLKPISSAVSIGSGGPFGAEGPIIVTGGAIGSITGQLLHLTGIQRRCLLVAGAAGGMTAVFGTPLASVLLAVELLLFEWRPRSLVPTVLAVVGADVVREQFAHAGWIAAVPLFGIPAGGPPSIAVTAGAIVIGLTGGALAWLMTRCVYAVEDLFLRLPVHWAWWPAIGGAVVGLVALADARILGAGYATIDAELTGQLAFGALALLLVCKLTAWSIALGSNTSGGILAPLLMLGAALGGMLATVLPHAPEGTWAVLGMAAAMAGVMRSPLTSIVFAVELTHDADLLLPLLLACGLAHLTSVLVLRRSILTEKIARRGYHVSREYEVDPLQALFVRDVMATDVVTVTPATTTDDVYDRAPEGTQARRQRLYPVLGEDGRMTGVLPWSSVLAAARDDEPQTALALARVPVVAHPDETLRHVADRMAAHDRGVLPVVDRADPHRLLGLVNQFDLLAAHERLLIEERHRERPLSVLPAGGLGTLLPLRRGT